MEHGYSVWHMQQCVDVTGKLGTNGFCWARGQTCFNSPEEIWKCWELTEQFKTLPAAEATVCGLVPLLLAILSGNRAHPKHRELSLVTAWGHHFPAHVLDRVAQSLSPFQNRNPFPFHAFKGKFQWMYLFIKLYNLCFQIFIIFKCWTAGWSPFDLWGTRRCGSWFRC